MVSKNTNKYYLDFFNKPIKVWQRVGGGNSAFTTQKEGIQAMDKIFFGSKNELSLRIVSNKGKIIAKRIHENI